MGNKFLPLIKGHEFADEVWVLAQITPNFDLKRRDCMLWLLSTATLWLSFSTLRGILNASIKITRRGTPLLSNTFRTQAPHRFQPLAAPLAPTLATQFNEDAKLAAPMPRGREGVATHSRPP